MAILLLADIVFAIEGIAHVIWPTSSDTGGGDQTQATVGSDRLPQFAWVDAYPMDLEAKGCA